MVTRDGCELQIDVSSIQAGRVNFAAARAAGVTRSIHRIARGNDGGDACAMLDIARARLAGIDPEGYCACYPLPPSPAHPNRDAKGQAALFLQQRSQLGLDGILWLDFEWPAFSDPKPSNTLAFYGQTAEGVLDWMTEAVAWVRSQDATPGIYGSPSYLSAVGCSTVPDLAGVPLWVAHYGVQRPIIPAPWSDWTAWQYDEHGQIPGLGCEIDLSWRRVGT